MPQPLVPVLTPHGALRLDADEAAFPLDDAIAGRLLTSFARGSGHGLLQLGAGEAGTPLPAALGFWRAFAMRFVTALCGRDGTATAATLAPISAPPPELLAALVDEAPPMPGGEYLSAAVLAALWRDLDDALRAELKDSPLEEFLKVRDNRWRFVGRVHLNLAENRKDPEFPFAFMATYTSAISAHGSLRHLPLGQALRDYAGAGARDQLLKLLEPLHRASESCDWLKEIVDSGEVYHPLRWTPGEAVKLLRDVDSLEQAGLIIRMPANWRMNRPSRPTVEATVGTDRPSLVGLDALLDFTVEVSLDGETLTKDEIEALLAATDGLVLLRGKWVEVDPERLKATLTTLEAVERLAETEGLPFADAMRLLAGANIGGNDTAAPAPHWGHVNAGDWLAETLKACRSPEVLAADPGAALTAELRPYQKVGVGWLAFLTRLGLGACLADDMGLGKTIQVLALLLTLDRRREDAKPSLLIAPASLLANWAAEAARFAPSLRLMIAHPAFTPAERLKAITLDDLAGVDLVVTSYGTLQRLAWLANTSWRLVVLDEAQAIKNPSTKQTRAVKALTGQGRIALTGTPIENNLQDLWSIFDFINPGLLGSAKAFGSFVKTLAAQQPVSYAPLRKLTAPYILRRLKTDRSIIADLPDKTEVKAWCPLTKAQATHYLATVAELEQRLREADGMARRGLVLASLMRLKQICNHPAQWLGHNDYDPADSGKFARLGEIAETLATRQEKLLVFTQFKEIIPALEQALAIAFGRPGLALHGGTAVAKRKDLVKRFQEDERVPFFVLSLKAGGAGLNLTTASHVVHFDR
jgi:non-specific serine/threonine protein kinase